ncbi:MAG: diadenylate cyclase CdaA [Acutalibacteraceae bacterium]
METLSNYLEKVWGALLSFNFLSDLLDIFLVTIIIYELIKLLRGSRTIQVLKGIGFLVVIYIIVKLVGMEASEYLLSVLFENALIILVVLFSPELRKVLEKFGRTSSLNISFFGKNEDDLTKEVNDTVINFCKAANDLSETKTGALVVFEKEAVLQEIINTGTVLDAKSSPELFNGLFFKNSALHDGAVVVRNGRIYAAGCILPLTQNNSLESDLGTRHRAAIGMSENSDAIAVVVSEETGAISYAKEGILYRNVKTSELREFLLSELVIKNNENEKKFRLPFNSKNKKDSGKAGESDEK